MLAFGIVLDVNFIPLPPKGQDRKFSLDQNLGTDKILNVNFMSSRRNSYRRGSYGGRQSERKKKLRQSGQGDFEIKLERPSLPAAPEIPIIPSIEAPRISPAFPIDVPEITPFQPEATTDRTLSHQPNKPGGPESK